MKMSGFCQMSVLDEGAFQIAIAPAASATDANARIFRFGQDQPLDTKLFATRITSKWYAIELKLPWSMLKGSGTKGSTLGFDLIVDDDDDDVKPDRDQYSLYFYKKQVPTPCAGESLPYCDDRTWCTTTLE